ncbi:hypothetical protein SKAU_G00208560 [Synaphobranchus kaupii]|uniref:Ankyrin repeat domain-containing protein 66 n=1 Tax=Synaphobranchus kaupii TaxID=118154 RepID=A0A9Q1F8A5_SYNKA|nr:hypothetical protein SKAU_G00208560 [Synaphobranchus kaupii]
MDMLRILVENGARPCLRTDSGWTPAHFAAKSGRLSTLRLLHSIHAPIDKEDCSGDRPSRIADIYGHKDCVEFLETAEMECRDYRRMACLRGVVLDDTDEEWEEQVEEIVHRRGGTKGDKKGNMCVAKRTVKLQTKVSAMSRMHI